MLRSLILLCSFALIVVGFVWLVNRAGHSVDEPSHSPLADPIKLPAKYDSIGTITAPSFHLAKEDGAGYVSLDDFHEKQPVLLIFGSFT